MLEVIQSIVTIFYQAYELDSENSELIEKLCNRMKTMTERNNLWFKMHVLHCWVSPQKDK